MRASCLMRIRAASCTITTSSDLAFFAMRYIIDNYEEPRYRRVAGKSKNY